MLTDALLNLVPPGSPLSLANLAAGASVASQIIDILGVGVGQPPQNIIGTRTLFGQAIGTDWQKPAIVIYVGTAFTTSSACTLTVAFQGSIDSGSVGTPPYSPNAWTTYIQTPAIAAANLTAGAKIILDVPRNFPSSSAPRFVQLLFETATGDTFTAGTIATAVMTLVPEEYSVNYAAKNYVVA